MFRYRLETLLRYRQSREEVGQRALATADRRVMSAIQTLKAIEGRQQDAIKRLEQISQAPSGAPLLSLYDKYIAGLKTDSAQGVAQLNLAETRANEERAKLMELVKKRKIIELHKEKLKERYNADQTRRERLQNDEIATTHHGVRKGIML